jgi:hypothetical protein
VAARVRPTVASDWLIHILILCILFAASFVKHQQKINSSSPDTIPTTSLSFVSQSIQTVDKSQTKSGRDCLFVADEKTGHHIRSAIGRIHNRSPGHRVKHPVT